MRVPGARWGLPQAPGLVRPQTLQGVAGKCPAIESLGQTGPSVRVLALTLLGHLQFELADAQIV